MKPFKKDFPPRFYNLPEVESMLGGELKAKPINLKTLKIDSLIGDFTGFWFLFPPSIALYSCTVGGKWWKIET